jgi:hypothetical protein
VEFRRDLIRDAIQLLILIVGILGLYAVLR